eukprot:Awhi_evm1s14075
MNSIFRTLAVVATIATWSSVSAVPLGELENYSNTNNALGVVDNDEILTLAEVMDNHASDAHRQRRGCPFWKKKCWKKVADDLKKAGDVVVDLVAGKDESSAASQVVNHDCNDAVSTAITQIVQKQAQNGNSITKNEYCDAAIYNAISTAALALMGQGTYAMYSAQCAVTMASCCHGQTQDNAISLGICKMLSNTY